MFRDNGVIERLGEERTRRVVDQFCAYLLHAQSFRQCLTQCHVVAGRDLDITLRRALKASLVVLIDRPFYPLAYRPALMRACVGDAGLASRLGLHPDVLAVAARVRTMGRRAALRSLHRVDMIGPAHADAIGRLVLDRVTPHAGKFVKRRARFLTMGEGGLQLRDIQSDLLLMGLRCFRWYYPFRGGVHMDNTVRATITNRGLSYVKHHTRQCRARMVTDAMGVTTNMESHDDLALERYASGACEQRTMRLRLDVARLARDEDAAVRRIVAFVSDEREHDAFVDWVGSRHARARGAQDVVSAATAAGRSYDLLVGRYLELPTVDTMRAFARVRGEFGDLAA